MSKARPEKVGTPTPNLHFVMIVSALIVIVLGGLAYYFAPPGKETLFSGMVFTAGGFLFGKYSNSFGKPLTLTPPPIVHATEGDGDGDGQPD